MRCGALLRKVLKGGAVQCMWRQIAFRTCLLRRLLCCQVGRSLSMCQAPQSCNTTHARVQELEIPVSYASEEPVEGRLGSSGPAAKAILKVHVDRIASPNSRPQSRFNLDIEFGDGITALRMLMK